MNDLTLAKMADLAYMPWDGDNWDKFVRAVGSLGGRNPEVWSHGDTEAFYCEMGLISDPSRVLAFRGTEIKQYRDIISDIRCLKTLGPQGFGNVHAGFDRALDNVWGEIAATLALYSNRSKSWNLYVTGHSMGGALARQAAARMLSNAKIKDPCSVVTFGEPKSGDKCFAQTFDFIFDMERAERRYTPPRNIRYVNSCDWVPRVPFGWMGYRHTGQEIYLTKHGDSIASPSWIVRVRDMLQARKSHPIVARSLCHPMAAYLEKMEALVWED